MSTPISIVIPFFNESAGIRQFLDGELLPVIDSLKPAYKTEVVLVDDGSSDDSVAKIQQTELFRETEVRLVSFSRNFGKEVALSAGLSNATGEAVIMIDADGQHPAEVIPEMLKKWREGAVVVTAVRGANTTKHKLSSRLYYRLMRMMGNKNLVVGALDFRLLDRSVVDEFNQFSEHNRLTRSLIDWLGYPQAQIAVETKGRLGGKPTYSFKHLVALAGDSMVSMSRTPLVIFGYIGVFITFASIIFGAFILIEQYILGDPLRLDWSGAVAMSVFVSFLVGLVLISQAITALYISQIHSESKARPLYVIDRRKSINLPEKKKSHEAKHE